MFLFVQLAFFAIGIPPDLLQGENLAEMIKKLGQLTPNERLIIHWVPLLLNWVYFTFLESAESQATLGKRLMGLKVTDLNGQPINLMRASVRHFAKILSTVTLFYGYLMPLFNKQRQTLHDKVGRCLVVLKTEETEVESLK